MMDTRISRLAQTIVRYSTEVRKGDFVVIRGYPFSEEGLPLMREIAYEVIRAGGFPHLAMDVDEFVINRLYREGGNDQITFVDPMRAYAIENVDVGITVQAARNSQYLAGIDPARISAREKAYTELYKRWFERTASKEMRWMYTSAPTSGYAQDAQMSLEDFEAFLFQSMFCDQEDPVDAWQRQRDRQASIITYLSTKSLIELKGLDIDLRLSVEDRIWENSAGENNLPDGEVFTGPIEASLEGWVRFSYPVVEKGQEVEGVELHFEKGKVVHASAEKNEAFLQAALSTDPGASYVGEFAFGTNDKVDRFFKNILFDEKIGGTIHFALGAGYPETGSKNESAIHWDMICDMRQGGEAYADSELFYQDGKFLMEV